jgi:uncharacterized membrane protein YqjE
MSLEADFDRLLTKVESLDAQPTTAETVMLAVLTLALLLKAILVVGLAILVLWALWSC